MGYRHGLNANGAIIRVQKKAVFCNIMIQTSTRLK